MPLQAATATSVSEPLAASRELQPSRDQIAALAQALWEARGCPEGSAEDDWYRAEEQLSAQTQTVPAHS